MQKLIVFNHVSLDGYFVDQHGEMNWAQADPYDAEWNEFVADNASGGGTLIFGRVTYEQMASFWPTPLAAEIMPEIADRMNNLRKIVFSRTIDKSAWQNTTMVQGDIAALIRTLKAEPGQGMAIMGSGTIVAQLAQADLIDEYQFVVNPIVLGKGRTMFDGLTQKLALKLTQARTFANGNMVLCYVRNR